MVVPFYCNGSILAQAATQFAWNVTSNKKYELYWEQTKETALRFFSLKNLSLFLTTVHFEPYLPDYNTL